MIHVMPRVKPRGIPTALRGFGQRMRQMREEADLSMGDLAEEIGASKSTLSLAERGLRFPNLPETVRIAEALGVRVAWLVMGEVPMRGRVVSILVEDDGDAARDIRRELSREFTDGPAPSGGGRRKSGNSRD
jgi:transcriptional regulator with XRE-family HTH domain